MFGENREKDERTVATIEAIATTNGKAAKKRREGKNERRLE